MKRIITIILCFVLALPLSACGTKTYEQAVTDADAKVEDMNGKHYNTFQYYKTESEDNGHYDFIMLETTGKDIMQTKSVVDVAARQAYEEIKKCFKGHDVSIGITVMIDENTVLYTYSDEDLSALKR